MSAEIPAEVITLSSDFREFYEPEKYAGTHVLIELLVPVEHAKLVRVGTDVRLVVPEVTP